MCVGGGGGVKMLGGVFILDNVASPTIFTLVR